MINTAAAELSQHTGLSSKLELHIYLRTFPVCFNMKAKKEVIHK